MTRQSSPGPRSAIGISGDITKEKLDLLREVDAVYLDEIRKAGLYDARSTHAVLGRVANRIINECRSVNRVTYDITSKPPGTIEWE